MAGKPGPWGLISYWAPPVLWAGAILGLSGDLGSSQETLGLVRWLLSWVPHLSLAQIVTFHGYLRKVGHFVAYGTLYFLWYRAFYGPGRHGARGRAILGAFAVSLCLALADEGHQSQLASRGGSLWDVALDMSGAGLSAVLSAIFWKRRSERAAAAGKGPAPGGADK